MLAVIGALGLLTALAFLVSVIVLAIASVKRARRRIDRKIEWAAARVAFSAVGLMIVTFMVIAMTPKALLGIAEPQHESANAPRRGHLPAFVTLSAGLHVILDSNGEGDDSRGTLFDSLETAKRWASGNGGGPADLPHHDLPAGTQLTVRSWTTVNGADHAYIIARVIGSSIEGYSWDLKLLPDVRAGTTLVVKGLGKADRRTVVDMEVDVVGKLPKARVPIGSLVRFIRYDASERGLSQYFVEVISGPALGTRGYLGSLELGVQTHGPVPGDEYDAACDCVGLFLYAPGEARSGAV